MVSSSAFVNGACIPEETESLMLLVDDPDSSSGSFIHWSVWIMQPGLKAGETRFPGVIGTSSYGGLYMVVLVLLREYTNIVLRYLHLIRRLICQAVRE
ncbi:hypothetical protein [Methanolobus sp.]|uniref:hypothetical protein n=1 Tax=Methanolobus sp. TaxID=1874737 RepID=UPI0025F6FF78|nr:hypothetical protein [Methanolobus sp.]